MAPIIEVSGQTLETLNPKKYTLRTDLETSQKPEQTTESTPQIVEHTTDDYIVIPADFVNGRYSDIAFSPARIAYGSDIAELEKQLGRKFPNTATDSLGREFIGKINYQESIDLNSARGEFTLSLEQGRDAIKLLYQGARGEIEVFDASGKKLGQERLQEVFDDILKPQFPWRAERFDTFFEQEGNRFYILTQNRNKKQRLRGGLMQDRNPGIDLADWIENSTKSGLPKRNIKKGNTYYWGPRHGTVASVGANSNGAGLNCGWVPSDQYSGLGVRAAKQLK